MKRRILNLFCITSFLLVLIGSGIAGVVSPQLATPKAEAAGRSDDYLFDLPNDGAFLAKLKDVQKKHDYKNSAVLGQTKVYARSGVFGDKPSTLTYNQNRTGCAQSAGAFSSCNGETHFGSSGDKNLYVYSVKYSCQRGVGFVTTGGESNDAENWVIDFSVSVYLGDSQGIFDGNTLRDATTLHWAGFSSIKHWPANKNNVVRKSSDVSPPAPGLPFGCRPVLPAAVFNAKTGETGGAKVDFRIAIRPTTKNAGLKALWDKLLGNTATTAADSSGPDPNGQLDCDTQFSNPLSWVICPVVDMLAGFIDIVDGIITAQMDVSTTGIFCSSDTCNAYFQAWKSFRNIALGLLAIAGLIVVISQALGMEILDAYTIRKTLPRLLIAAIGISISWPLMRFAIDLTNDLGYGIRNLIYVPFSSLPSTLQLDFGTSGALKVLTGSGGLVAGATGGAALWIVAGGIGVLLSYAATGALAVLVAILVLILREIAIYMLLIVAPIGIVAYVLPNTQRIWKLWWESFSKALLMFPLIAAFIATGRVFAAVAISQGSDPVSQLIGFIAYFAPYFLIPLTFKFAGGFVSQLGGFVNDRGSGAFGALRNYRKQTASARLKAARSGGMYRNDFGAYKLRPGGKQRYVSKSMNTLGNWTADFDEQARVVAGQGKWYAGGRLGKAAFGRSSQIMRGQIEDATIGHSRKALQDIGGLHYQAGRALGGQLQYFAGTQNNDGSWSGGDSQLGAPARQKLIDQFGVKDSNGRVTGWNGPNGKGEIEEMASILSTGGASSTMAAQELRSKAPILGSYRTAGNEETIRADVGMMGRMAAAQAGRLEPGEIANIHNAGERDQDADMPGMAGKEVAILQQLATGKRTDLREGHGIQYSESGEAYSVYRNPFDDKAQTSIMSMSSGEIAGSKSETIDAIADTVRVGASEYQTEMSPQGQVVRVLQNGNPVMKTGDELKRAQAMQARIQYLAQYSQGDSDAGRKLNDLMTELNIPTGGGGGNAVGGGLLGGAPQPPPAGGPGAPGGPGGGAGGPGGPAPPQGGGQASDIRLKTAVRALNMATVFDLPLYRFKYLWDDQEYVGVMAQEVQQVYPDAVSASPEGWLFVDYAKLGTKMYEIEEWNNR